MHTMEWVSDVCHGRAREAANSRQTRTGGTTAAFTQAAGAPPGQPHGTQGGTEDVRGVWPGRRAPQRPRISALLNHRGSLLPSWGQQRSTITLGPAVDGDGGSGDEGGVVGDDERQDGGELGRLGPSVVVRAGHRGAVGRRSARSAGDVNECGSLPDIAMTLSHPWNTAASRRLRSRPGAPLPGVPDGLLN